MTHTRGWTPDVVIYHHPCADGFGAAWAAWTRWGHDIEYVPANYGQEPPDVTGKRVLIVDFSYQPSVLRAMEAAAASIIILDHHRTAQADLEDYVHVLRDELSADNADTTLDDLESLAFPRVLAVFDMQKSGARLAWEFCHPGAEIPWLIRYIEDRDLWRFQYVESKPLALWLRAQPQEFNNWEIIAAELQRDDDHHRIIREARAIESFYATQIAEMVASARIQPIDGIDVPVVNCPGSFASDVGNALLVAFPDAPFAACYHHGATGGVSYSLRSDASRMDVSAIAKKFGGGGHRNAAGFRILE